MKCLYNLRSIARCLLPTVVCWGFWIHVATERPWVNVSATEICEYPTYVREIEWCPDAFVWDNVTLECQSDKVIQIIYANHGIDNGQQQHQPECGQFFGNKTCYDDDSTKVIAERCDGNTTCTITTDSGLDSCPSPKYLTVLYWCIKQNVSFRVRVDRNPPTSCPMDTQYLSSTAWDYESSSPYNCNPQLSHSSPTSRIMLQRFSSTGPYVKVITTLSGGAVCMSLALTAMVEIESGDNTVTFRQCQMVFEDDDAAGFRRCVYTCLCEGPCPRVHLQFYSLQAIGTDNLGWSLCNIEMCVPSMHNEL